MVTRTQLLDLGFFEENFNSYYFDSWEYQFIINKQELYYTNDGFGEPEFIAKIKDVEHLKEVMCSLGYHDEF